MTDKVMRPIRKEEYAYWDYNTDSEYEARKSSLKSEMIDEIDEISETNYPKFQARLKLDTLMDDIKSKHQEYHQFVTNKNMIEQEKKNKLDKAVDPKKVKLKTNGKATSKSKDSTRGGSLKRTAAKAAVIPPGLSLIHISEPTRPY